jgi:hypothetical protein
MFRRWFSFVMWNCTTSPGPTGFLNFALSIVMK